MWRESTDKDISDEECEKVINPFYDNYHTFVEEYVMPEVIAYYLANSFYRNAMWEATFLQHFNSASDMFNLISKNYEKTKEEVIKLLRLKYALEIISEDPLDFKRIEYPLWYSFYYLSLMSILFTLISLLYLLLDNYWTLSI